MRYALQRSEHDCYITIFENTLTATESAELVVPDIREDVGEILDVRAQLTLSSKRLTTDCAVISASVYATALYLSENGEKIECVNATIPIEFTVTEPGIDEETVLLSSLRLGYVQAKALNPRKLLFKAQVSAAVQCLIPDNFSLCSAMPEGLEGVHCLEKSVSQSLVALTREKTFTVADEFELPEGLGEDASLVATQSELCLGEVKSVGTKLVFKAMINTTALFMTGGVLRAARLCSSFSQIIETDEEQGGECRICPELMSADFTRLPEDSKAAYAASFRICVTALCSKRLDSVYIADAYSNRHGLELETAQLTLCSSVETKSLVVGLEGSVPSGLTPDYLQLSGVTAALTAGGSLRITAVATGICSEGGAPRAISLELSGSESIEPGAGESLRIISLSCEEPSVSAGGQVSALATVTAELTQQAEICPVCALELSEEDDGLSASRPSVTVLLSPGGESDLWALAKKFGSTVSAIEAANSAREDFCAQTRPLLVPKAQ